MTNECCKNCRYWDGYINEVKQGWCRRHPPTVITELEVKEGDYSGVYSNCGSSTAWPETDDDDWCGEFKEKEKDEVTNS